MRYIISHYQRMFQPIIVQLPKAFHLVYIYNYKKNLHIDLQLLDNLPNVVNCKSKSFI